MLLRWTRWFQVVLRISKERLSASVVPSLTVWRFIPSQRKRRRTSSFKKNPAERGGAATRRRGNGRVARWMRASAACLTQTHLVFLDETCRQYSKIECGWAAVACAARG